MKRNAIGFILTLGLLSVSPLAAQLSLNIDCQPLVVYDVSGFAIAGPVHQHLAVYSDGMTSVSSLVLTRFQAELAFVPKERAYRLLRELISAGALELRDRWASVADMPMSTVTVFDGNSNNANHNTFSFYDTASAGLADRYREVVLILNAFIDELSTPVK